MDRDTRRESRKNKIGKMNPVIVTKLNAKNLKFNGEKSTEIEASRKKQIKPVR